MPPYAPNYFVALLEREEFTVMWGLAKRNLVSRGAGFLFFRQSYWRDLFLSAVAFVKQRKSWLLLSKRQMSNLAIAVKLFMSRHFRERVVPGPRVEGHTTLDSGVRRGASNTRPPIVGDGTPLSAGTRVETAGIRPPVVNRPSVASASAPEALLSGQSASLRANASVLISRACENEGYALAFLPGWSCRVYIQKPFRRSSVCMFAHNFRSYPVFALNVTQGMVQRTRLMDPKVCMDCGFCAAPDLISSASDVALMNDI